MHVLIDGRPITDGRHGIGRYTLAVLRTLPEAATDLRATVICTPEIEELVASLGHATIVTNAKYLSSAGPVVLAAIQRQVRPDVTFCPSFAVPIVPRRPLVVTLHDATHLTFPADFRLRVRVFYKLVTLPAARAARTVITVSDFSRRSLESAIGLRNIVVIPNGVDLEAFSPEGHRDERVRVRSILYAGGYKPHKRVELLVDALAHVPDATLALVGDVPTALIDRARAAGVVNRIEFLGSLGDSALAAAYRAATIFCYPSAYEGFGLPPLEAMACGTPVVCADSSSLPEVVGEAGVMFRGDAAELAEVLASLLDDNGRREKLKEQGLRRARSFEWRQTAARTADVLRAAAN
jgi:glycosyltransferase involved in cell wall biosynthesis